eukprot:CAMPEP_0177626894 /NCGR_PEP_ID=MMETSP0419_2-20121207/30906_1 /TAXON_ID=582737 /ORGANISM="Tetraselmis sp., Strain GSL018" /LENGTH=186 /DNA_ID=CAMNT_0019127997 /DNA_START=356 /DNA_END=913 /DNA_ORIENTATION=+
MKEMSRFQNYCEDSAVCHFTTEDEDGKAVVPLRHVPGFWLQANGVPTAKVRELEERAGEHAQNDEPNKDPGSILSENNAQQAKEMVVPKQNRVPLRHVPGFWLQANGVPTAKVRELEERAGEHAQNDEPNKDPGSILSENNAQQAKEMVVPKQNREQLRFKVPLKQGASHAFSAGNHAGSEKQTRM